MTTKQESALAVMAQRRELRVPPMYFTPDRASAARSVATMTALEPEVIATGHGEPLRGRHHAGRPPRPGARLPPEGRPRHGRYVNRPAMTDESESVSLPPELPELLPDLLLTGEGLVGFVREFLGEDAVEK